MSQTQLAAPRLDLHPPSYDGEPLDENVPLQILVDRFPPLSEPSLCMTRPPSYNELPPMYTIIDPAFMRQMPRVVQTVNINNINVDNHRRETIMNRIAQACIIFGALLVACDIVYLFANIKNMEQNQ